MKRVIDMTPEAWDRLDAMAVADNASQSAIVEHLVMGRMVVVDGVATVPELVPGLAGGSHGEGSR